MSLFLLLSLGSWSQSAWSIILSTKLLGKSANRLHSASPTASSCESPNRSAILLVIAFQLLGMVDCAMQVDDTADKSWPAHHSHASR